MDVPGFALVTGAASGIGKACAAGVALLDVNGDALTAVKAHIDKNEDQIDRTVQDVARDLNRLDDVVNAAGITFKHEGSGAAFTRMSDWTRVLDVNLDEALSG